MKGIFCFIVFSISIIFSGCKADDNPVKPVTIEQQINNAKPLYSIEIYYENGRSKSFKRDINSTPINANAENGYLVVEEYGKYYFNLSQTKNIIIGKGGIEITY